MKIRIVALTLLGLFILACTMPEPTATEIIPTPTPEPTPEPTATEIIPTPTPEPTPEPTATEIIPTPTPEPTPEPTATEIIPTPTPEPTPEPTATEIIPTPTPEPTPEPTATEIIPTPTPEPTPEPELDPTVSSDPQCDDLYTALRGLTGDRLVQLVRQADEYCLYNLEWVNDKPLQAEVSREANLITIAEAIPPLAAEGLERWKEIERLNAYLIAVGDIHYWCRTLEICDGFIWDSAKSYPIGPGTPVYAAVNAAVDSLIDLPIYFIEDPNEVRAYNLRQLGSIVNAYDLEYLYLPILTTFVNNWDEADDSSPISHDTMYGLLEILHYGHQSDGFGAFYGEDRELMEAMRDFVLDSRWLGTKSHWIMERLALEIGRYPKYGQTANYTESIPIIRSIIEAYEGSPEARSIWLRILSEVNYNDPGECSKYGTCDWYEGNGFHANFRKVLFPIALECPKTACDGNSIAIHAQDLDVEKLELACDRLYNMGLAFQEFCGTDCKPVEGDANSRLEIFIFNDGVSCDELEVGAFPGVPDSCSGIYWEGDPEYPDEPAVFVATEYTLDENPLDPDLAIWNFEHEYAHYLDGRYNRAGGYSSDSTHHWWIEGFAEYFAAEISPYIGVPNRESPHSLLETILYSGSLPVSYSNRHLAVRFMLENHRDFIDEVLTMMRVGEYEKYVEFMKERAPALEDEWQAWLEAGP